MNNRSKIESYFRNEMNELEQLAFLDEVYADPQLKEEFNQIKQAVLEVQLGKLQEELHLMHEKAVKKSKSSNIASVYHINEDKPSPYVLEESKPNNKSRSVNIKPYLIGLIGLIILIFMIYFIFSPFDSVIKSPAETKAIFQEYYAPDPGLHVDPRDLNKVKFNAAMVDYKAKKYQEALQQWENYFASHPSDTVKYYIAQTHLALRNPDQAYELFNAISSQSSFADKSYYYSALSEVSQGYSKEAVNILEKKIPLMTNEAIKIKSQSLLSELQK